MTINTLVNIVNKHVYCICSILCSMVVKTLVRLQLFPTLTPTGTSPPEIHTHTHTPRPEEAVVSSGNGRGSSTGPSVRAGTGAVEPDGRSCRSPPHSPSFTSVSPQRATYPTFTGSPFHPPVILNGCQPRPQLNKNPTP